jgi:hypothetical protein
MKIYLFKKEGQFYFRERRFDGPMHEYQLTFKDKNGKVKFYTYKTITDKHGTKFAECIKLLLVNPVKFREEFKAYYWSQINQNLLTIRKADEQHEKWEQTKPIPKPTRPKINTLETIKQRDKQPQIRRLAPQRSTVISFIKDTINSPEKET